MVAPRSRWQGAVAGVCVFQLVAMGLMSRTLRPVTFLFATSPGWSCLALAGALATRPGAVWGLLFTERWFSADLALGAVATFTSALVCLGVHVEHVHFHKTSAVSAFALSQVLWANGLNAVNDFRRAAAGKKDDDAPPPASDGGGDGDDGDDGDDAPKSPVAPAGFARPAAAAARGGDASAQAGAGAAVMVATGLDIIRHIERAPGNMDPLPFALVGLSILLLGVYSTPPVALKHRALGEFVILCWVLCVNGILALTLHRDPLEPSYALASLGCALLRPLANFCANVRDAPADDKHKRRTLAIHLGAAGIKKAYAAVPLLVVPAATACLFATGPEILALNLLAPWGLYVAYDALSKSPGALAADAKFYDYTQATACALGGIQFAMVLRDFL